MNKLREEIKSILDTYESCLLTKYGVRKMTDELESLVKVRETEVLKRLIKKMTKKVIGHYALMITKEKLAKLEKDLESKELTHEDFNR